MERVVKIVSDLLIMVGATALAIALKDGGNLGYGAITYVMGALIMVPPKAIGYLLFRLDARSWSAVAFRDLGALAALVASGALVSSIALAILGAELGLAITLPVVDALVTLAAMGSLRAATRAIHERRSGHSVSTEKRKNVLVVGAGESGVMTVRDLLRHPETGMRPIGFVDDASEKRGMLFGGVPVLGKVADLGRIAREHHVTEVLIAMPSEGGSAIRRVLDIIKRDCPNVTHKIVPGVYELLSGKVDVTRLRNVEITDLLGRSPVRLDTDKILEYLKGKRVLITGAGGSIGSELVRQICRFQPAELILFGHGENSIYALERELDRDWPNIRYTGVIGAIQNGDRLDYVFAQHRPDIVFHAAAHKHVPLMEQNPEEAVFNNIIGSRNLINMALKYRVSHFVNISTDKAVHPSSVMGASKRMVEYLVQDASQRSAPEQVFVSVRFGNVLGSRGSVIPIFKSQILAGGPVTVTHPDMVRYFMTIPEASQLVLQSSGNGRNGEIYILDMGKPVRILDLARDLIRLSGYEPDVDIPITFTGVRPGEKMSESLMTASEKSASTSHEHIFVANVQPADHAHLMEVVSDLQRAAQISDHAEIRRVLEGFLDGCSLNGGAAMSGQPARPVAIA